MYASQMAIDARVIALNEQIVALRRNFGASRSIGPQTELARYPQSKCEIDIVIVTMANANVLDLIQIDPAEYSVELFTGEPLMLSFETQRVARERAKGYDIIGMMEDDLIIHDPTFFEKLRWFGAQFGPRYVLQPQRVEVSRAGRIGKMLIEPTLRRPHAEFEHPDAPTELTARFLDRDLKFTRATNPHSGTWFLTAEQFALWEKQPYFYDRVAGWVGPLESAATRGLAMTFPVYRCASDAYFLEVEHFGVRFANTHSPAHPFRSGPFLRLPEKNGVSAPVPSDVLDELMVLRMQRRMMAKNWSSRSRLARRLASVLIGRKGTHQ